MITENLSTLKIHKLTQEQYDRELAAGNIDESALYLTPDEEIDLSLYATIEQVNAKADVEHTHSINNIDNLQSTLDEINAAKANSSHTHDDRYYTETEIDEELSTINTSISNITDGTTKVAKAESSDKLTAAKTISLRGDVMGSVSFDGSSDVSMETTVADDSHRHSYVLATSLSTSILEEALRLPDANASAGEYVYTLSGGTYTGDDLPSSTYSYGLAIIYYRANNSIVVQLNGRNTIPHVYNHYNGTSWSGWISDVTSLNIASQSVASATKATQDGSGNVITSTYETKDNVSAKLEEAKSYTDSKTSGLASTSAVDSKISTHDTSTSAHSDIRATLAEVKEDVDTFFKDATISTAAKDTLKEIQDYIDSDAEAAAAMTASINNKADKSTTLSGYGITDAYTKSQVDSALSGKADSSHGTHVTFDSTNKPKMDGTAAFGTSTSVARADHIHPTDTTRASKTEFDTHTSNTTVHITSTERTNWNAAKTHADSAHVTGVKGNSESTYRTGSVNITPANIGLGNVENKSSATIRGELTKENVTNALGYTPPETDTTYTAITNDEIDEICTVTMTTYFNSISSEEVGF